MLTPESALRKDKRNANDAVMEHRHYAVIAEIIADVWGGTTIHTEVVEGFACSLATTQPNFNRARFLRACGVAS